MGNSTTRQEKVTAQRERYMAHEISHHEYYCWLSDLIGLPNSLIPATNEEVAEAIAKDEHLNNIPLLRWDRMDGIVRSYATGLSWALSDTVCCLKAMAKRRAEATKEGAA